MLERLSASVDGVRNKGIKIASDRLNVFGTKKQVPFHVVISELRAELMNTKQHAPGQPCVLLWIRGDTVHVTEESVGQTVLSWSETYFAQVVPLHVSGSTFRPKECKFKVQQKGKTIAKTAILDLTKYCSEIGLARDQSISVPLQPCGTLYFVISTAPALEHQNNTNEAPSAQSSFRNVAQASHNPSHGGGGNSMVTGLAASVGGVSEGGATSLSAESSKLYPDIGHYATTALKYSGTVAGAAAAAASSIATAITPPVLNKGRGTTAAPDETETAASATDDGDRPSVSGRGHQRKPSNGPGTGWMASGVSVAAAVVTSSVKASSVLTTPQAPGRDGVEEKGTGTGVFKRKTRGNASSKHVATAFAAASGAAASAVSSSTAAIVSVMNAGSRGSNLHPQLTLRKSDSDNIISAAASARDLRGSWDAQAERSLSQMAATGGHGGAGGGPHPRGSGSGFIAVGQRAIRSFTGTPGASHSPGPSSSPLQIQLPPSTLDGIRNLARRSGAASTCSDTAASVVKAAAGVAAAAAEGGGGGGGWGSWLRSGLGWGRSNHSATGTSTGALSHNGAGGGDRESTALEAEILGATEPAELREVALDLLHERDEWRVRAIASQDALGRAQTARGSAVREAQRLEVRLRQYQDELGRRTDGSLLKELVEAKVRIAELANENMKLRRQITHMGPLFYDDSGDE
ncbi:hypothetical protein VaNZ11_005398 [Volvox africanus]|uniref:C2 NT-type domain-containing protein n=1 Tax=Volvox africanus TaxID=51714 RepID=A0ABQ5RYX0_9CHLO|nr:hypothetical protein VaNZ11_005398 [Volvox africanus]